MDDPGTYYVDRIEIDGAIVRWYVEGLGFGSGDAIRTFVGQQAGPYLDALAQRIEHDIRERAGPFAEPEPHIRDVHTDDPDVKWMR